MGSHWRFIGTNQSIRPELRGDVRVPVLSKSTFLWNEVATQRLTGWRITFASPLKRPHTNAKGLLEHDGPKLRRPSSLGIASVIDHLSILLIFC